MPNDLDNIDYSSIHAETQPAKKTGITSRKLENKPAEAAPVDVSGVVQRAADMQQAMGAPTPAAGISNYGLEALGTLGALGAAYQAWKNRGNAPSEPSAPTQPSQPTSQEAINQMKLERERIKTEQARIAHENWLAKNTLTEAEQIFGRKAKDATELRLMEKAYEQQKSGVAGATAPPPAPAAPVAPSAVSAPAPAPSAAPVVPAPTPAPAPAPTAPAPTTAPANELSNWLKRSPTTETPAVQQVIATTPTTPAEVVHAVDNKEPVVAADKPLSKAKKAVNPADVGLTKEELGMKNHLLGMYGGKNNPAALDAYEKVKEILGYTPAYPSGQGGSLAKEETAKILGYRKEEIPGPKINLTKDMKSILKKGGEAAAVLAATIEFANAKTSEQKATAGTNLLGAVLPPGADILEAGAPTVSGQSISNAYKLGSPYAQTEEAKKARLKEKAGAGRGIAPPSAYMR